MSKEIVKDISFIERDINCTPTIIDGSIQEGCIFRNTFLADYGTIIVDKDFIDEILLIIEGNEWPSDFIELLLNIYNIVKNYFYSSTSNSDRVNVYDEYCILDDEGRPIGTKLSSLKGKNVALCSEKSVATYIILDNLYRKGKVDHRPSMILSNLRTRNTPSEPHAFILVDKEQDSYPTRHVLYDVQNPTLIEDELGERMYTLGLYTLSDEQHNNIIKGIECTPRSLAEVMRKDMHDIGDERIYGSFTLDKSF